MPLQKQSFCKVNLLLNILGKRPDGFHELETVMQPVALFDELTLATAASGIELTCSEPTLPTDSRNLVYRAAEVFLNTASIKDGVRLHLEKKIPMAAGLGGGSGNAASTLLGLNELFDNALEAAELQRIATSLGSDIPFFLQRGPALATGRGEQITALTRFPALRGAYFILVHPGFGISTPWAYLQLQRFPEALNGQRGRAEKLVNLLQTAELPEASTAFYNSLEAPTLHKYPLLVLFQEFFRANGAAGTLMSGSGSTTFALASNKSEAETLAEKFRAKFGQSYWLALVPADAELK
ncbi:MAG TPA: 4-(cytidine 5'-diphospho)-2-C-methyl-D-erythritol kinase [Candidatus Dormibacteraeota bacterium]|nr:4-(cytidine 5'-diphospho)-2-C-methyl-D-erythritol kinase [Candidatus Dormibacteraeota bacterium]